jgi:diguanylate cyclase (GGDEF)-like protein/PAS domain S-box-containing protein
MVPIMVDGKYWGQIAFDSCDQQRDWADYEIESLQTIAELFGTAIQRDRYLKELADANRIVQNTPTILYRMRGEPTLPMIYISQNIKLFGHDPAALTASPLLYRSLIHPDDLPAVQEAMAHALVGETGVGEFRLLTSRGEFRWVENHYMPLLDGTGRLVEVEGLLSDITERKSAEDKIARLARTDSLTGLANRSTFTERLRESFAVSRRGARPFAVLYLDIDRFKDVNDTLGHPIGDRLLITIGERMQGCVRETDILARIGGDEFAVLQSDLSDTADAGALADKLRAAIAETIQIGGNELHMTASIGIAVYEAGIAVPEDLLAQADVALYRAKEEGRDQYRFHTQELDTQVREQVAIAEELRRAVGRGELELHYQPQVEFSTSHITGMEALIRWRHPKRGLLLPGQFIEVAERTGTITSIGQWVLDSACRQMSAWRAAGVAPSTIAVNVSAVQLKAANEFVELVSATLKKWHLAAGELELDVTESTLARVALAQNDVLERLQKMGVRIAIDDFGMEYSSLDYLKTYHVNRIKIPRPLLDAALRDRDSAAVVRAIVDIARELGIEIVAGGVETEAEWSFLAARSPVQKVQGYYYSKPVPADDATALLRGKRIEPGASAVSSQES